MLLVKLFNDMHLQLLRITGVALLLYEYTIRQASKLLETLTIGNQRIAVTIDGEDLMAFVHAVYEDAQQKAAIAVEKQNAEEFIGTEQVKQMLKDCYWIAFYPKKYQDSPQALRERIRKNKAII